MSKLTFSHLLVAMAAKPAAERRRSAISPLLLHAAAALLALAVLRTARWKFAHIP